VFFYYWDKAGRVIFGVFGDAIDEPGVRFGGNHFALEIEVKPSAGHFSYTIASSTLSCLFKEKERDYAEERT